MFSYLDKTEKTPVFDSQGRRYFVVENLHWKQMLQEYREGVKKRADTLNFFD